MPLSSRWPPEVIATLFVTVVVLFASPLNHDAGWVLAAARRLVQGERLYIDIFETNPPLIFWLFTPIAFVGQQFSLPDTPLVALTAAVQIIVSAAGAQAILNLPQGPARPVRSAIMVAFLVSFAAVSGGKVAQRDPVAAALLFPYVLLAARRAQYHHVPASVSVWCGILSGLGVALKPFFVLPWLAIELVVLYARVRPVLRLEACVVVSIQLTYLLVMTLATPEYFSTVVPLVRAGYSAYDIDPVVLMDSRRVIGLFITGMVALAAPALLRQRQDTALARIVGAATIGFLASYVLQSKGYSYHLSPAVVFAGVAAVVTLELCLRSIKRMTAPAAVMLLPPVWCLATILTFAADSVSIIRKGQPPLVREMVTLVQEAGGRGPVFVLSTGVWPAFPVVNLASASWPYHFNCLWPLPAFYAAENRDAPYRHPQQQDTFERIFFDTVVTDLIRNPPSVLIVGRDIEHQAMHGRPFDFIAYFSNSHEFGELIAKYRRISTVEGWEILQKYR